MFHIPRHDTNRWLLTKKKAQQASPVASTIIWKFYFRSTELARKRGGSSVPGARVAAISACHQYAHTVFAHHTPTLHEDSLSMSALKSSPWRCAATVTRLSISVWPWPCVTDCFSIAAAVMPVPCGPSWAPRGARVAVLSLAHSTRSEEQVGMGCTRAEHGVGTSRAGAGTDYLAIYASGCVNATIKTKKKKKEHMHVAKLARGAEQTFPPKVRLPSAAFCTLVRVLLSFFAGVCLSEPVP